MASLRDFLFISTATRSQHRETQRCDPTLFPDRMRPVCLSPRSNETTGDHQGGPSILVVASSNLGCLRTNDAQPASSHRSWTNRASYMGSIGTMSEKCLLYSHIHVFFIKYTIIFFLHPVIIINRITYYINFRKTQHILR